MKAFHVLAFGILYVETLFVVMIGELASSVNSMRY